MFEDNNILGQMRQNNTRYKETTKLLYTDVSVVAVLREECLCGNNKKQNSFSQNELTYSVSREDLSLKTW